MVQDIEISHLQRQIDNLAEIAVRQQRAIEALTEKLDKVEKALVWPLKLPEKSFELPPTWLSNINPFEDPC